MRVERFPVRFEQPVGRSAGEIVQRAVRPSLDRLEIERTGPIAEMQDVDAQGIKCEIERELEIRRKMGLGDLEAMRLQILDQNLTEAAFLAHHLLAGARCSGQPFLVFGRGGYWRLASVSGGLRRTGIALTACGR